MIYVLEVHNKNTNIYAYVAQYDEGALYLTSGAFIAKRFDTFDEVRNEYQRLVSAPVVVDEMTGRQALPSLLWAAVEITCGNVADATLTISILEISDVDFPAMKVNRIVNHTVQLSETDGKASVTVE